MDAGTPPPPELTAMDCFKAVREGFVVQDLVAFGNDRSGSPWLSDLAPSGLTRAVFLAHVPHHHRREMDDQFSEPSVLAAKLTQFISALIGEPLLVGSAHGV